MAKNLDKRKGITDWGFANYGFLRSKGYSSDNAWKILIKEDKAGKNASTFRQRRRK